MPEIDLDFEFLQNDFAGSTLKQWIWCLLIMVLGLLLSKLMYQICSWVAKHITARTKTLIDDELVEEAKRPFIFLIILLTFYVGLHRLTLAPSFSEVVNVVYIGLMTINATWFLSSVINVLMDKLVKPLLEKKKVDNSIGNLIHTILRYVIWGVGIVIALDNMGYDITAMIAGLGIGGLALAMAAQDSVSNFFGGFTIMTDHPFNIKDRIRIGGIDGTVENIGLRSFRIRTLDGTQVVIPNSQAVSQVIENVSAEPSRKVKLELGLTYDTTPEQMQRAMDILVEIGKENKNVQDTCQAYFNNYGDFSLGILFVYYIKKYRVFTKDEEEKCKEEAEKNRKKTGMSIEIELKKIRKKWLKANDPLQVQTEVNMEILKRFNAEGLNFAFPTQTLYTIQNNEAEA